MDEGQELTASLSIGAAPVRWHVLPAVAALKDAEVDLVHVAVLVGVGGDMAVVVRRERTARLGLRQGCGVVRNPRARCTCFEHVEITPIPIDIAVIIEIACDMHRRRAHELVCSHIDDTTVHAWITVEVKWCSLGYVVVLIQICRICGDGRIAPGVDAG